MLDTHAVVIGTGSIRQRIVAQQRRRVRLRVHSQDNELTRESGAEWVSVCRLQHKREHAATFPVNLRHSQRAEPWPRRWWFARRPQARVSRRRSSPLLSLKNGSKGRLPSGAQSSYAQRAL